MNKNKKRVLFCFTLVWTITAGIFFYRFVYDLNLYRFGKTIKVHSVMPFDYLLRLPKGYTDGDKRPLIVFLHGAGEVGKGIDVLETMDPYYYANGHISSDEFPFIVLTPSTPLHGWKPELVVQFLETFLSDRRFRLKIDESRIYLTGFSMGGFGTFETAAKYPERFAAIAPVAGGFDPKEADKLRNVPVWAFHADADTAVSPDLSINMIKAMENQGRHDVKLTLFAGADHGICDRVYGNPDLYRWFLENTNSKH